MNFKPVLQFPEQKKKHWGSYLMSIVLSFDAKEVTVELD